MFFLYDAARTLKEKSKDTDTTNNKEVQDNMFKAKEEDHNNVGDDVFSMDYTPARRKPPIHN